MNVEKKGWLLLWTAISNEIASSDETQIQRDFFSLKVLLFFLVRQYSQTNFHYAFQSQHLEEWNSSWFADSAAHMNMGGRKYFAELQLDFPFKYTCWNLSKNPVSLDFAEHSRAQNCWKSCQSVGGRKSSLLFLCKYCFAVFHDMLAYWQFSVIVIMLSIKCSFRNAGA